MSSLSRGRTALFLILALISIRTPASSVLPLSLDQLLKDAETVFEGRCVENRTSLDPSRDIPVTYTRFEIRDVLKGAPSKSLEIKQAGGALKDRQWLIEGVPHFEVDKDYVVFLYGKSSEGFSSPVGLEQGQFEIAQGPDGAPSVRLRPDAAAEVPGTQRAKGLATDSEPLPLSEFKAQIRQRLKTP